MALQVTLGSTTLTSGGSTALGNIRSTARPQLSLRLTNPDATTLTGFTATPGGDGMGGGGELKNLAQNANTNYILEIDVSGGAGSLSATISFTHSGGTWTHTFTGTVVATAAYTGAVSIVKNDLSVTGEVIETIFTVPARKLVDASTTISFTSGGDEMELLVSDSANGLGDISVGDQVEVSGASQAVNNFYWQAFETSAGACKFRIHNEMPQTDASIGFTMTQDRDGATEAAGSAITISLVPEDIAADRGEFTIGGAAATTAKVLAVQAYNIGHLTYVHVKSKMAIPAVWGDTVTMTAAANAAWQMVNGQGNDALTASPVRNFSQRKFADQPYGYDNWKPIDGVTDAPHGVGEAIDPLDIPGLIAWGDPDLEAGYSDGDPIDTLTNQIGTGDFVTRNGASYPRRYDAAVVNGKAMTYLNGVVNEFANFRAWKSPVAGNWTAADRTVVFAYKMEQGANSFIKSFERQGFNASTYNISSNTGVVICAMRVDTSGNATTRLNYVSMDHTVSSNEIWISSGGRPTDTKMAWAGRIFIYDSLLTDGQLDRITRHELDHYGSPWAPTYYCDPVSGDDTATGTIDDPLKEPDEALNRCGAYTSPHIVLKEGAVYSKWVGGAVFKAITKDFDAEARQFGHSHYNPICIYTKRETMQEPYARFPSVSFDRITDPMRFWHNFCAIGCHPRNAINIPTTSPLREPGDAAFTGQVYENPLINFMPNNEYEAVFPYPAMAPESNAWFINCPVVGNKLVNLQSPHSTGLAIHRGLVRYGSAHGSRSIGINQESYISSSATVVFESGVFVEGGHESSTGGPAANIRSRSSYNQFAPSPGVSFWDTADIVDSSGFQFRSGGVIVGCITVDSTTGASGQFMGTTFIDHIIEAGTRKYDGVAGHQDINWGLGGNNATDLYGDGILFLPANTTRDVLNFDIDNNPTRMSDATIGAGPSSENATLGKRQRRAILKNITVAGRGGPLAQLHQTHNVQILNSVFQSDAELLRFRRDSIDDITDSALTVDGVVWDGSGDFATVDSVAKTQAEINAISGITITGIVENAVTFKDPTRSWVSYAETKIGSGAKSEDLAYEIFRQWTTGEYNADMQPEYIIDWVRGGYLPTGGVPRRSGGEFDGMYYGAIQDEDTLPTIASSTPANGATGVAFNQSTVVIRWSAVGTQGLASSKFYLHDAADDSLLATIPANLALVNALDKTEQTVTLGITIGYGKSVYLLWDAGVFIAQGASTPNAANTDKTALAFSTESAPAVGGNRSRDRSRER